MARRKNADCYQVAWHDEHKGHRREFEGTRAKHMATMFFKELPLHCSKLDGAELREGESVIDRWYTDGVALKLESVSGPQLTTTVAQVTHESELTPEQVKENLRQYPLPGCDPEKL